MKIIYLKAPATQKMLLVLNIKMTCNFILIAFVNTLYTVYLFIKTINAKYFKTLIPKD